jgi:hypothetical protein
MHIEHTALIIDNYDDAIQFFVDALGFDLIDDSPVTTTDGRSKRWVVVRPPEAQTGLLLAQADGDEQVDAIGHQYAGRVGLFLRVVASSQPDDECSTTGSSSTPSPVTSPMAALPCSSTLQETDGTCSDRPQRESDCPIPPGR